MSDAETLAVIEAEILAAEMRYAEALAALREACPHAILLEAGYQSNVWGYMLPLRICEACGTEEEDWSFRVLKGRAYPASRSEVYKARRRGPRYRVTEARDV